MARKKRRAEGKRRASGEGTLYYDAKRQRWIAQLPPDPLTGKRAQRTALTQAEALEKLEELKQERKGGRDLTARYPTLNSLIASWLEDVVKPNKKASTYSSHAEICRLYIEPTIGRLRLDAITPELVQRWVNTLAKRVGPFTVRSAHQRLRTVLNLAIKRRHITHNPAVGADLPPAPIKEDNVYSLEELRALLRAAAGWRLEPLLWLLALTGVRKGEALGAAWRNYDKAAGTLRITQQVQLVEGKTQISLSTKTERSRRVIPLPPRLLEMIEAQRGLLAEERKVSPDWKEHLLIFPSEEGTPIIPGNLNGAFKRLCTRAGVRCLRVHDLRHTCATLLADLGVSEGVIAALLGHAPATVTRRYAHVSTEALREAVTRLERALMGEAGHERQTKS